MHAQAEQLALVDAKFQAHERAIADTMKRAALSGDLFSKSAETAIAELEESLGALLRHRQQLEAWQTEGRAQSERKRRLWELADQATSRLRDLSPKEKRSAVARREGRGRRRATAHAPQYLRHRLQRRFSGAWDWFSGSVEVGRQGIEP